MVPDDIESTARTFERAARNFVHAAAHERDQAAHHRSVADLCERRAAQDVGNAHGFAFRAAELRYDARGGMTAATERRRFEPGAAWLLRGVTRWVTGQSVRFHNIMIEFDDLTAFELGTMTRANGWLFLGLSDQGGYR